MKKKFCFGFAFLQQLHILQTVLFIPVTDKCKLHSFLIKRRNFRIYRNQVPTSHIADCSVHSSNK
jgi:hypothetical protein